MRSMDHDISLPRWYVYYGFLAIQAGELGNTFSVFFEWNLLNYFNLHRNNALDTAWDYF
jgi:hypothetical protein